jgi:signal transduction histidine kinase
VKPRTAFANTGIVWVNRDVIGKKVVNLQGEDVCDIEEVVIDSVDSRVTYAVMSFGGFLGIGDKLFAVRWVSLKYDEADAALVSTRTTLVNAARGLTKSYGERLKKCGTEQMNREIAKGLSQELRDALDPLLGEIESLNERIAEYDGRIEQIAKEVRKAPP